MREGSSSGTRMPVEIMAHHQNGFADEKERMNAVTSTIMPSRRPVGLTMSVDDSRTVRDGGCVVLGVLLVDERGVGKTCFLQNDDSSTLRRVVPVILGSVLFEKRLCFNLILADELRNRILKQVPSLSGNFCFLTKNGWPISKEQERLVCIDQIVTDNHAVILSKQFEKTRVGVLADEKEHLGFIFIEVHSSLRQVRDAIGEQLKESKLLQRDFKFIEKLGFPVTRQQENLLTVADALSDTTLHILTCESPMPLYHPPAILCPPVTRKLNERRSSPAQIGLTYSLPLSIEETDSRPISPVSVSIRGNKKKSFFSKADHKRSSDSSSSHGLVAKPILISYVRAEAAQHALTLKEELSTLGFSVYLDVHEIKSGADWQDALNYAVSNCEVFVPLITPMYGKTQWTNREVKLADVKSKFIIPINFLEQWPPECLAIQFASTQYIAWKPLENDHMKGPDLDRYSDYRVWDLKFVKKVSSDIANRYKVMRSISTNISPFSNQSRRVFFSSQAAPISPRAKTVILSGVVDEYMELKERQMKLVVISAHPKQLIFADTIKKMLEAMGYQVWCSTELIEEGPESESFGVLTPLGLARELSTIPEGETIKPLENTVSVNRSISSAKKPLARTDSDGIVEKRTLARLSSQMSTTSMVSESLSPDKLDRLKKFQEKGDDAGVVIIIASEAYFKSTTSKQQAFYCEHRKKIILIKYDQSAVPALFSMLMGNDMITNPDGPQFSCAIKARVKRELDPASSVTPKDATMEVKMQYLVSFMKKNLPVLESCVYVSGSSRLQNERSAEICKEIGKALAKVKNINVVTGGFYGAGDITARAFEEALQNNPRTPTTDSTSGPIFHILPVKDTKDFTKKATQNEEGSFEPVPYGNTLFLGDSVKERESVVARLFDICIVVEGGPGAAHEVEEFIWNDHYVVPIISSGGAAGGDFGVPLKIFETPPYVSETDWSVLSNREASPQSVAQAVVKIVIALKTAIANHSIKQNEDKKEKQAAAKANRKRSKRSRKLTRNAKDVKNTMAQSNNSLEFPMIKSESIEAKDKLVCDAEQNLGFPGHSNRWQRICRYLRPTCLPTQP